MSGVPLSQVSVTQEQHAPRGSGRSVLSLNSLCERCLPDSNPEADMLLKSLERSQCQRMDDQRVLLSSLPGIGGTMERKPKGRVPAKVEGQVSCLQECPQRRRGLLQLSVLSAVVLF